MNSRRCGYKKINLNAEDAKDFAKGAAEYWCSLKKWHGRPAREDTRKMRVPHQTAPALAAENLCVPLRKPPRPLRLNDLSLSVSLFSITLFILAASFTASAQRAPSQATRPFVVMAAQSLDDLKQKLQPGNKTEELIDSAGMQLRVAVQHEKNKTGAAAELHDASDDVYYVMEGSATLVLGGKLDAAKETEPGEWRSPRIIDGKTIEINKGDIVIVPRGTPHQRSTANKDFTMILIKIYEQPLKPGAPKPTSLTQKP